MSGFGKDYTIDDAGRIKSVSDQTTDAVAQARESVWDSIRQLQRNQYWSVAINHTNESLDALIAAVRAECAAKVDAQADALDASIGNESAVIALRKLARTLEAQP